MKTAASRLEMPAVCLQRALSSGDSHAGLACCRRGATVPGCGPVLPLPLPPLAALPTCSFTPWISRAELSNFSSPTVKVRSCSFLRSPLAFAACSPCWVQIQSTWWSYLIPSSRVTSYPISFFLSLFTSFHLPVGFSSLLVLALFLQWLLCLWTHLQIRALKLISFSTFLMYISILSFHLN